MDITKQEIAIMRQRLFGRARDQRDAGHPEFRIRPISEEWRLVDKVPAYRTAVANVAYIWRDSEPSDRFGRMPKAFAERRFELRDAGLILPASAPLWATKGYTIWEEADRVTTATGDPTAISGWHVILEIPAAIPAACWKSVVTGFIEREITSRGNACAWATHALEGADGWIEQPHTHCVVTARTWRHVARHGRRATGGIGSWGGQRALEMAWRRHCQAAQALASWWP